MRFGGKMQILDRFFSSLSQCIASQIVSFAETKMNFPLPVLNRHLFTEVTGHYDIMLGCIMEISLGILPGIGPLYKFMQ